MNSENKQIIHENKYVKLLNDNNYLVYQTPDIICALPVLPNGDILLIEQFRIPVEKKLLELVTGGINEGEDSKDAAVREVREETGYSVKETYHVGSYYSAPGYITQQAHVYVCYVDEFQGTLLEEHEEAFQLNAKRIPKDEIASLVSEGETHPYLTLAWNALVNRKEN